LEDAIRLLNPVMGADGAGSFLFSGVLISDLSVR
jgi:hypothetical protein